MSLAKITLTGQEIWLNHNNKSLFDLFELPEDIDRDNCIDNIMMECGELETLYSDPEFMTLAVNIWGRKNYWTFDKWIKLINKEYDPLYNKDYYEDIHDTHEGAASGTNSSTDNYTNSRTDKHSEKAYNTGSGYNEIVKDESSGSNGGTTTGTFGNNDSYVNGHTYHGYGNIGITSAQELFLKEADVARFNLYEQIADLFCNEFCIMVF